MVSPIRAQAARSRRRRSSTNEPMASPPSTMTGIAKRALRIVPPMSEPMAKSSPLLINLTTFSYPM